MMQTGDSISFPDRLTEPAADVERLLKEWPAAELLEANLAALAATQPELAEQIRQAGIPPGVERVVALDGSVTFKVPCEIFETEWLGYCSTPFYAAQSLLERIETGSGNLAMVEVGNGFIARLLLEKKVGLAQSLIAFENLARGPRNLKLVFQLHDLSAPLSSGRLVLLCGDNPTELLAGFYHSNPGYQIVTTTVMCPWRTRQENSAFNRQVTQAMESIAVEQKNQLNSLTELWNKKAAERHQTTVDYSDPARLRTINLPGGVSRDTIYQSRDLLAGFADWGGSAQWLKTDQPGQVAMHWQLKNIVDHDPDLLVMVNKFRNESGLAIPGSVRCLTVWTQPADDLPDQIAKLAGPQDGVVCYRPDVLSALREKGLANERTALIAPPVDPHLFFPAGHCVVEEGLCSDIAMISDRYSTEPQRYQINLPSHQLLWKHILAEIEKAPAGFHTESAHRYLNRAQACGVTLQEKELRDNFTRIIRQFIGRSALKDTYCKYVLARGYDLKIWDWAGVNEPVNQRLGTTWSESPCRDHVAGVVAYDASLNRLYQSVKLVLEIEPVSRPTAGLLSAIAAEKLVLVRTNPDINSEGCLGKLFNLSDELITFDTPEDLVRKIRHFLDHPDHRQTVARRARQRLLDQVSARHIARRCLDLVR